jgi:sec-independent protein translocase protein TatB
MLPEVGATERLVIAAVALIVVGPKDLPALMRKAGQFLAKLRGMANEFRASFEDMARQSELDELRREVEAMRNARLADVLPDASPHPIMQEIDQALNDPNHGVQFHPMGTVTAATEPQAEPVAEPKPQAPRKPRAPRKAKLKPEALS